MLLIVDIDSSFKYYRIAILNIPEISDIQLKQRGAGKSITLRMISRISVISGRASSRRHCTV